MSAGRAPPEDDPVACVHVRNVVTDFLDDAGGFVAEQKRRTLRRRSCFDSVQIAVTDTGRLDSNDDLAGTGRVEHDLLDA